MKSVWRVNSDVKVIDTLPEESLQVGGRGWHQIQDILLFSLLPLFILFVWMKPKYDHYLVYKDYLIPLPETNGS